jgi:hypothetical protein
MRRSAVPTDPTPITDPSVNGAATRPVRFEGTHTGDLQGGVLDDVRNGLGRDLLGGDDAFAVAADLGEQAG